jgi:hypothetical protein
MSTGDRVPLATASEVADRIGVDYVCMITMLAVTEKYPELKADIDATSVHLLGLLTKVKAIANAS